MDDTSNYNINASGMESYTESEQQRFDSIQRSQNETQGAPRDFAGPLDAIVEGDSEELEGGDTEQTNGSPLLDVNLEF